VSFGVKLSKAPLDIALLLDLFPRKTAVADFLFGVVREVFSDPDFRNSRLIELTVACTLSGISCI
jgi:hypothetical protein